MVLSTLLMIYGYAQWWREEQQLSVCPESSWFISTVTVQLLLTRFLKFHPTASNSMDVSIISRLSLNCYTEPAILCLITNCRVPVEELERITILLKSLSLLWMRVYFSKIIRLYVDLHRAVGPVHSTSYQPKRSDIHGKSETVVDPTRLAHPGEGGVQELHWKQESWQGVAMRNKAACMLGAGKVGVEPATSLSATRRGRNNGRRKHRISTAGSGRA
ncbi:hypothetical protein BDV93DRAFT_511289 [Ceratobasidium sp. AG-I]|nr:hypothetical protein BDV93DRAFT_511289 [Ceratobasidium sp. AG-I]